VALRFATDHNLPEPILAAVEEYVPFEAVRIKSIDERLVDSADDWQVLLAVHQAGLDGLITLDAAMTKLPREIAVLHQTQLTLVAVESATHDPLRAMGEVLVRADHFARMHSPTKPQLFVFRRPPFHGPDTAWAALERIAKREGQRAEDLYEAARLTDSELETRALDLERRSPP
jgi:hypothetical protein